MKTKSFFISLLLGLCANAGAQSSAAFKVKLDKPFKGKVYVSVIKDRLVNIDSVEVDGTEFSLSSAIAQVDEYRLRTKPYRFDVSVMAEPGCSYDITVSEKLNIVTTSDGKEQLLFNTLNQQLRPLMDKANEVGSRYMQLKEAGKLAEAEEALQANNALYEEGKKIRYDFINQNPNTYSAINAADGYLTMNYQKMKELRKALAANPHKNTYAWRSFEKKYKELADKWIQDKPAPDFTTTDINGKQVRLSDFRGHYVLLDFWASWCVPCRAKMKELKKVYPQLKAKNITVISISLDEKKEAWLKASQEDGIEWVNTCDVKPFRDNAIGKAYKVTSVPKLFVINPEGMIVSQDPTVDYILNNIGVE